MLHFYILVKCFMALTVSPKVITYQPFASQSLLINGFVREMNIINSQKRSLLVVAIRAKALSVP